MDIENHPSNVHTLKAELARAEQQADWDQYEQIAQQFLHTTASHRELMQCAFVLRKYQRPYLAKQLLDTIADRCSKKQNDGNLLSSDRLHWLRALIYNSHFMMASQVLLEGLALDSQLLNNPSAVMHKTLHVLVAGLRRLGEFERLTEVLLHLYDRQSAHEQQNWQLKLLQLGSQKGIFRDEILRLATQVVKQHDSPLDVTEAALELLLQWAGESGELADQYQQMLMRLPSDQLANHWKSFIIAANLLWWRRDTERLQTLAAHFPHWVDQLPDAALPSPALAWLVLNDTQTAQTSHLAQQASSMLAAEQALITASQQLWFERLAEPAHQIAVVGNSVSEFGRRQGHRIDQHQSIIRFNRYSLAEQYCADYGSKVHIEIQAISALRVKEVSAASASSPLIVVSYVSFFGYFCEWPLIVALFAQGHQVACYPAEHYRPVLQQMRRIPSSGLMVAAILSSIRSRQQAVPVSYYGFAFVDQIGEHARSSHYFEQSKPALHHDWQQELQLFKKLTGHEAHSPITKDDGSGLPRIKLIGDHSKYHCGCAAVSDYLTQQILRVGRLIEESNHQAEYDILVVNGEGSMHHMSNAYQKKINMIQQALQNGKPAFLVNSIWQENSSNDQALLQQLTQMTVRESLSQAAVRQEMDLEVPVYLDCSYWADVRTDAAVTDFKQQLVVTDFYSPDFEDFVRVTKGFWSFQPYIDLKKMSWSSLVNSLKTASLLVTGRHHAMYAACRARTPFVVLTGNTHKIAGLIRMSGLPIPVCQHPKELKAAITWAKENRAVYDQLFDWMDAQPRLDLAKMLLDVHSQ